MKSLFTLLTIITISFVSCTPTPKKHMDNQVTIINHYDSIKAQKYGADDYGMKKYVMAFLKRGPNRYQDSITTANLQKAHLQNITQLTEEGKLVLAGPFFGNDDLRGIYIFDVSTLEEAKTLTATDPAIQAGTLVIELKEWYGSAALMEMNTIHKQLEKKSVAE